MVNDRRGTPEYQEHQAPVGRPPLVGYAGVSRATEKRRAIVRMTARKTELVGARRAPGPIRIAVLRGLAVVLPPLLTIVIFMWGFGIIRQYVYDPVTGWARDLIVAWKAEIHEQSDIWADGEVPDDARALRNPVIDGVRFQRLAEGEYVPKPVYDQVVKRGATKEDLASAEAVYHRYVDITYLQPWKVILLFVSLFILILYLLGKFMAAGVGRFFYGRFERGINSVPIVRKVYSSVKQVSDFIFANQEIQYSRVVAVEWPRKGIWCLALVTGSSLKAVEDRAGEEVLSVLIPTSPMPMTGFTVTVKKSETVDLDITIDQAVQFIVSCGVVAPADQMSRIQSDGKTPPELVAADNASKSDADEP